MSKGLNLPEPEASLLHKLFAQKYAVLHPVVIPLKLLPSPKHVPSRVRSLYLSTVQGMGVGRQEGPLCLADKGRCVRL